MNPLPASTGGKPWPGQARGILPAVIVAGLSIATTACARTTYDQRYPVFDSNDRAYYDGGFRDGRESGVDDARRGRSYDVTRHGEYRDNRRGNDATDLRAFRTGFEAGYDEGYRSYARGNSRRATHRHPPIHIRLRQPRVIRVRQPRITALTADATLQRRGQRLS
jgi:hypothetical protein